MKMKIVLYSAIPNNTFDRSECRVDIYPSPYEQLSEYVKKYPENQFVIITTPAHLFLVNQGEDRRVFEEAGVKFHLVSESSTVSDYVQLICDYQPDLAIAMTFPGVPIDGNTILDAVISEKLNAKGIQTIAHSCEASQIFADKWLTHQTLRALGFPVANAVHIPQMMYYLEKHKSVYLANTYKELAEHEMQKLHFPVVIKGAFSSAAIGVQIAENIEEATAILEQYEDDLDLIVEEKIEGVPFGAEIHGYPGHYVITPPFKLSTGEDGISSATDNVKGGPFLEEKYRFAELTDMLLRLAEETALEGNAQVDLFYTASGWKILEINPRISGMTVLIGAGEGHSILECLLDPLLDPEGYARSIHRSFAISVRVALQSEAVCRKLLEEEHIINLWQNDNLMLQNCQITLGGYDSAAELYKGILALNQRYPSVFTEEVVRSVKLFRD